MPGNCCCVKNCHSMSHDLRGNKIHNCIRFFKFPTWKRHEGEHVADVTRRRRMAWVAAVRRKDLTFEKISQSMRVCSLHFHSGEPSYEMQENHPDWKPSLLLGHSDVQATDQERFEWYAKRKMRADCQAEEPRGKERRRGHREPPPHLDAEQQPQPPPHLDADSEECALCRSRQHLINCLLEENRQLKEELDKHRMNEQFLGGDDAKVKYYTGLPSFAVLQVLLCSIMPFLSQGKKLTHFQIILLTLIRLRLDLPIQHLSHLFRVHRTTVSAAFQQTAGVLYARLSPLVHWPDRENLMISMPHQFVEAFGKHVAAIVDCFEIFIERPSNLQARAQTFSQYKHNHTLKYLIVITPQGVISFISKGWGGHSSDKLITERCGFLNKLLPGDIVLADRGFNIRESVGMMCAEVKIPAYTKGHAQLDAKDVEETRAIAHLRIHVERVIGVVRNKYKMLHSKVPISMVLPCKGEDIKFLDKIVTVCCALTNMCPAVI
uniref:THAP-type domain-containing protein n=1 Tax=Sinocyclocheilus grahami TaxID=75366 RepID=A0A672LSC5_SINGR